MLENNRQSGITLVEVVVSIAVTALIVVAIGFAVNTYVDARTKLLHNSKSLYLAEEGHEIIRALRDTSWSSFDALALDTTHYLEVSTSTIDFTATPEVIDTDFRRSFIIRSVYRDFNDDFATSTTPGASIDPDTKEVHVYVSSPTGTTSLVAILTNIHAE